MTQKGNLLMPINLHKKILGNALKFLRLVEGRPPKSQWRGVALAESLCKQVRVDISKAVGSEQYPNIEAAQDVIQQAVSNL